MKRVKLMSILCGIVLLCGCGILQNKTVNGGDELNNSLESKNLQEITNSNEGDVLNIAYQYGLAYAPLTIIQEQRLIEKAYKDATGKEVVVTWNQMSSGPDINTAFVSGSIDVGFMGIAPAITGISNHVGYKIFTNLSGQEHGLMTSDDVYTLEDLIDSNKQIALVNIGSIQHIILARAIKNKGYDAHILDPNIVAMKHPDGMNALESGSIPCHLTTNPYLFKERENGELHEIEGISDVWNEESSFIVGVASQKIYENNPELYKAMCDAISDAIDYINDTPEQAAAITYRYNGNSIEDELKYLTAGNYSMETKGIFELAKFMADAGFIENEPDDYNKLVFENVRGD